MDYGFVVIPPSPIAIVSNAALISSRTSIEIQPWSEAKSKSFVILTCAVSVL